MLSASRAVLIVLAVSLAAIGGAFAFEIIGGLKPCPLCLQQRVPYYVAILAMVGALMTQWTRLKEPQMPVLTFLALASLGFAVNVYFGVYHSGAEWGWWPGPPTCSGDGGAVPDFQAFKESLGTAKAPVRCDEAPIRIAGLSLAGYNVLISLFLMVVSALPVYAALKGARRAE